MPSLMNPVFLYIPNLVGYARFALLFSALAVSDKWPIASAIAYSVSQFLDALDGHLARALGQCSRLGAVLDMLCDRMSTLCLLVRLAILAPDYWLACAALMVLDIVSHWIQMYSKLLLGETSHKTNTNVLLRFYYSFPTLFIMCVGNEAFFISQFLVFHFKQGMQLHTIFQSIGKVSFPIFVLKQFFNVVQMLDAAASIAEYDIAHKDEQQPKKLSQSRRKIA